jgi:hypothetical protein
MKLFRRMMQMSSGYGIRLLRTPYTGLRLQQLFTAIDAKQEVLKEHYQEIGKAWEGAVNLLLGQKIIYGAQSMPFCLVHRYFSSVDCE